MIRVHRTNKDGFTLIEILIGVAIVGLMLVVVAPAAFNLLGFGKRGQTNASVKGVQTAILQYHLDTNSYPETLQDLISRPSEERISSKWHGPYLDQEDVPYDGWAQPFVYHTKPGKRPPYELYSYGENGPDAPREEWIGIKH